MATSEWKAEVTFLIDADSEQDAINQLNALGIKTGTMIGGITTDTVLVEEA